MKQVNMSHANRELLERHQDLFNQDEWKIEDRAGPRHFTGRLIGMGTSERDQHNHDEYGPLDGMSQRCTACRWSEIYIFEVTSSLHHGAHSAYKFCVYTVGPSIVRGENTRANVRWATSGFEVVELATVRRGERAAPFLPAAHARALAMAAEVNESIAEAYINRAVA